MIKKSDLEGQDDWFEHHRIEVDPGQEPIRIDKFLQMRLVKVSRNRIQNAVKAGAVLVDNSPVKSSYKVQPRDLIRIVLPTDPSIRQELEPEQIPLDIIYEDEDCMAFRDINPKAPVHFLVIPRRHMENLFDATPSDEGLLGRIQLRIQAIAKEQGLDSGFRTVLNTGPGGHQEVYHMHYHVLGGGPFSGFN